MENTLHDHLPRTSPDQIEFGEIATEGQLSNLFTVIRQAFARHNKNIDYSEENFLRNAHPKFFPKWLSKPDTNRMKQTFADGGAMYSNLTINTESGTMAFNVACTIGKTARVQQFNGRLAVFKRNAEEVYGIAWQ